MEAIPPNAPTLRGKEVDLCMFIDSNNSFNKRTTIPKTRFMMYMNMSFIVWYFKKQSTVETSVSLWPWKLELKLCMQSDMS